MNVQPWDGISTDSDWSRPPLSNRGTIDLSVSTISDSDVTSAVTAVVVVDIIVSSCFT